MSSLLPSPESNFALPCRSINIHLLRQCNYKCKFCFHTPKADSFRVSTADLEEGLRLLKPAMLRAPSETNAKIKVNFAGGEPSLVPELGDHIKTAKRLGFYTSVISNGSRLTPAWVRSMAGHLDMLGLSVHAGDDATLRRLGFFGKLDDLFALTDAAHDAGIAVKVNTTVCRLNQGVDMAPTIARMRPARWKIFQAFPLSNELRDNGEASLFIGEAAFAGFVQRHLHRHGCPSPIVESSATMRDSYLVLDERLRFLDSAEGAKHAGPSILEVGVRRAFEHVHFDSACFARRKGEARPGAVDAPEDIEELGPSCDEGAGINIDASDFQ